MEEQAVNSSSDTSENFEQQNKRMIEHTVCTSSNEQHSADLSDIDTNNNNTSCGENVSQIFKIM